MRIEYLFTCTVSVFLIFGALAQKPQNSEYTSNSESQHSIYPKDNPQARVDFEILKTKNPKTGQIPKNIRFKEAAFMSTQASRFRTLGVENILVDWHNREPINIGGRTRALAVDAQNEDIILAGGISGGVWRSSDQGLSWLKATGSSELQSVTCIAQDPRTGQTNTWYYGTGELRGNSTSGSGAFYLGDGIYKSTDNGLSWSALAATVSNSPESFSINTFQINNEIVVNPSNGDVLVASYFGIQRSQDGGSSFVEVLNNPFEGWSDIVTTSTGILFAAMEGAGVFRSTDNGTSWSDITDSGFPLADGDRIELALAASNENILYAITEDVANHALWKFDDSDDSWIDRSANVPALDGLTGTFNSQGGYNLDISVRPDDENFVIIGGRNLWRSTDGFASVNNTSWIGGYTSLNTSYFAYTNHHSDQHSFVFLSGNKALSGNDGGVQITQDITTTNSPEAVQWISLNNGYRTTQVYALSQGPQDQLIAGFQDNGTWFTSSPDGDADWTLQITGDGSYSGFHSNGTTRFMSWQNGSMYRYEYDDFNDNSRGSATYLTPDGYSSGLFIPPIYMDPLDNDILYMGGDSEIYINDQASTGSNVQGWTAIDLGTEGSISEFGVTQNNLVYVGNGFGELFKVEDPVGTPVVTEITGTNFPGGYISGIGVNQYNPDKLIVCFSNYSVKSIFYTDDGGDTWVDVSGTLEENYDGSGSGPSARVVRIMGNNEKFFVGTSTGLYSTSSLTGATTVWTQEDPSGIGNVVVEHMIVRNSDGLVIAGTHGNGVFSANFELEAPHDNDLAVVSLLSPKSGSLDEESIVVKVTNTGVKTQSNFTLSLEIYGVNVVDDAISYSLEPDDSYEHTFSVPFTFSETGEYEISISLSDDDNLNNNLFTTTLTNFIVEAFPYQVTFDEQSDLPVGWLVNSTTDFSWLIASGSTPSFSTGPNGDHTSGAGNFIYTEASGDLQEGEETELISPIIDLTSLSAPLLKFYFHMWGSQIGGFKVVVIDENLIEHEVYEVEGEQQDGDDATTISTEPYKEARIILKEYTGEKIRLKFIGIRGSSFRSDVAIDDISIGEAPENDIVIREVKTIATLGTSDQTIVAIVENVGASDISDLGITYLINDVTIATETIPNVGVGEIFEHTFGQVYDFSSPGKYQLKVAVATDDVVENNEFIHDLEIFSNRLFTGEYTLHQDQQTTSGGIFTFENGWVFNNSQDSEITLVQVDEDTRGFTAAYDPTGFGVPLDYEFVLMNNDVTFIDNQTVQLNCSDGDIFLGTADSPGSYLTNDDSQFTLTLKDNILDGCSTGIVDIAFTLTRRSTGFAPSDILISNRKVDENTSTGNTIGYLFTEDQDFQDFHTYTIIEGGENFEIGGALNNEILVNSALDYEIQKSYPIKIRTQDPEGLFFDKDFTVSVNNLNESPTDIDLTDNQLAENLPIGTSVGTLSIKDQDAFESHSYSLSGSDASNFQLFGSNLNSGEIFDFETKNQYEITIITEDAGGLTFSKDFIITVTNSIEAPFDIALSEASIDEGESAGSVIGIFSVSDPDGSGVHTLELSGEDEMYFDVLAGVLESAEVFDYESVDKFNITITATDENGLAFSEDFEIVVNDIGEAPTEISLSSMSVNENAKKGVSVGSFSVEDQDAGDTHSFELEGTDASSFKIGGTENDELLTSVIFDFETKNSYEVTVTTTDGDALSFSKGFTISVVDVDDALGLGDEKNLVLVFPNPSNGQFQIILDPSLKNPSWKIMDLSGKHVFFKSDNIKMEERVLVDVRSLLPGIYILQVNSEEYTATKRISISKTR